MEDPVALRALPYAALDREADNQWIQVTKVTTAKQWLLFQLKTLNLSNLALIIFVVTSSTQLKSDFSTAQDHLLAAQTKVDDARHILGNITVLTTFALTLGQSLSHFQTQLSNMQLEVNQTQAQMNNFATMASSMNQTYYAFQGFSTEALGNVSAVTDKAEALVSVTRQLQTNITLVASWAFSTLENRTQAAAGEIFAQQERADANISALQTAGKLCLRPLPTRSKPLVSRSSSCGGHPALGSKVCRVVLRLAGPVRQHSVQPDSPQQRHNCVAGVVGFGGPDAVGRDLRQPVGRLARTL